MRRNPITGAGAGRSRPAPALVAMLLAALAAGPQAAHAQTFGLQGYRPYPTGEVPEDLLVGDFDEDGRPDIALGNVVGDSVSIFRNLGAGVFADPVAYPAGDRPEGIASADLDGNGTADIATANMFGDSVAILLGNSSSPGVGDGTFTPVSPIAFPLGSGPRSVVARDFDGDGDIDLATANYSSSSVTILRNSGAASFSIFQTISVGSKPEVIAAGRLDPDSVLDLVTCDTLSDQVTILKGTSGSATFSLYQQVPVPDFPRHVRTADLDGDGFDEIIVSSHGPESAGGEKITVIRTTNGTSFSAAASLDIPSPAPTTRGPIYVSVADLDGNGRKDLVATCARSDKVAIYPATTGPFAFGPAEIVPVGQNPVGVAAADLDGNGQVDLAVTNALDHNLYVFLKGVAPAAIIVDNGAAGTSETGSWSTSTKPGYYGVNSRYSQATSGSWYTWSRMLSRGSWAVYAWWNQDSGRNAAAPYSIVSTGGTDTVYFDQTANGGVWNAIGNYHFDGSALVQVTSTGGVAGSGGKSTVADAVCFQPLLLGNEPPRIETYSVSPSPASTGSPVTFAASASDPDGTIRRYEWISSIDSVLGYEPSFAKSDLSLGTHTIRVRAQDSNGFWSPVKTVELVVQDPPPPFTVVDNGQAGTSSTGTWQVSGGIGYYGTPAVYAKNGPTYTYTTPLAGGSYNVYAWWTVVSSRSGAVPYDIVHSDGTTTVFVDQRVNGGQWNFLGTFTFGSSGRITIRAVGTASTCADAVGFETAGPPNTPPVATIDSISPAEADDGDSVAFSGSGQDDDGDAIVAYSWTSDRDGPLSTLASFSTTTLSPGVHTIALRVQDARGAWSQPDEGTVTIHGMAILDNGQPGTSFTGTWSASGGPDPYPPGVAGSTSLYARNGPTYTYLFPIAAPGAYEVFAWWTEWSSRSSAVPYDIVHSGGTTTVTRNQKVDGGQWNSLGVFTFGTEARITIRAVGSDTTCADAMAIGPAGNQGPTASIVSVAPSPAALGDTVAFEGTATDPESDPIDAYEWSSSISGVLSTLASFSTSSLPAGTHAISFRARDSNGTWSQPATTTLVVLGVEFVLDNGSPGTSQSGSWSVSSASGSYGTPSVWSRNAGFYRYTFTSLPPGRYRVHAWWTQWPSRAASVPYVIDHAGAGTPATVTVDQRTNGARWNLLGEYDFGSTAIVTIQTVVSSTLSTCADAVKLERVP